jgi:hypothetical protein
MDIVTNRAEKISELVEELIFLSKNGVFLKMAPKSDDAEKRKRGDEAHDVHFDRLSTLLCELIEPNEKQCQALKEELKRLVK